MSAGPPSSGGAVGRGTQLGRGTNAWAEVFAGKVLVHGLSIYGYSDPPEKAEWSGSGVQSWGPL